MTVDGIQPRPTDRFKPHFKSTSALLPLLVLSWICGSTKQLPGQCSSSAICRTIELVYAFFVNRKVVLSQLACRIRDHEDIRTGQVTNKDSPNYKLIKRTAQIEAVLLSCLVI